MTSLAIYNKNFPFEELDNEFEVLLNNIDKLKINKKFLQFVCYVLGEIFDNIRDDYYL